MPPRLALDALLAAFEGIDTNTDAVTVRENLRTKINKFIPAQGTTWDFTTARGLYNLGRLLVQLAKLRAFDKWWSWLELSAEEKTRIYKEIDKGQRERLVEYIEGEYQNTIAPKGAFKHIIEFHFKHIIDTAEKGKWRARHALAYLALALGARCADVVKLTKVRLARAPRRAPPRPRAAPRLPPVRHADPPLFSHRNWTRA